ncbi:MAG: magnesium transporter [Methanobacteriaceae archaeon]
MGVMEEDYSFSQTAQDSMISTVPRALPQDTVGAVKQLLSAGACQLGNIDYVYVIDDQGHLDGVLSIKEVLSCVDNEVMVREVMKPDLVVAYPSTHQERVVYLALSHGIKSVPVVDEDGLFLGVVPYDQILRIFNHEVQSDVFNFGGIFHKVGEEYTTIKSSTRVMIRSRLPWLVVGVLGGTMAAGLIGNFEKLLSEYIVLAFFIPVMVYMSDAAGTQSEALLIRSMALDPKMAIRAYFSREVKVAAVIGLVSGGLAAVASLLGWTQPVLSIIVGVSMFLSVIAAVIIATIAPLIFKKLKYDPAVATGPLATIVSDITTLAIYFTTAVILTGMLL